MSRCIHAEWDRYRELRRKGCNPCERWRQRWLWVMRIAVTLWTPPFGATISICGVNIWRHQTYENYAVAVAVWKSLRVYSQQAKAKKIKEPTANIKENFQFRFLSVWTQLKAEIYCNLVGLGVSAIVSLQYSVADPEFPCGGATNPKNPFMSYISEKKIASCGLRVKGIFQVIWYPRMYRCFAKFAQGITHFKSVRVVWKIQVGNA